MAEHTDTISGIVRRAGWLDEGSEEQTVYLLTHLLPVMESILTEVKAIPPARLSSIISDLHAF